MGFVLALLSFAFYCNLTGEYCPGEDFGINDGKRLQNNSLDEKDIGFKGT